MHHDSRRGHAPAIIAKAVGAAFAEASDSLRSFGDACAEALR